MTGPRKLLLDTNILIHLVRANWIGRSVDSRFQLRTRAETPSISIISVGEALSFAKQQGWGLKKTGLLENLVHDLVTVDISDEILQAYAEIDFFLLRAGKPIQQNDIWIAATAVATEAHLLTTDKDFDPLHPAYLDRTWIDPQRPRG